MRAAVNIGRAEREPKTQAQFVAYIEARTATFRSANATNTTPGLFRVVAVSPIGNMIGSSWLSVFTQGGSSYLGRVMQHGLPSEAMLNALVASGVQVLMNIVNVASSTGALPSVNRNGYASTAYAGGSVVVNACDELLYFDPAEGPMKMNPRLGLGPDPFDW